MWKATRKSQSSKKPREAVILLGAVGCFVVSNGTVKSTDIRASVGQSEDNESHVNADTFFVRSKQCGAL